jgi:ankyrin repeat protein
METHPCRSLSEASRYNNERFVQKFISEGGDPNVADIFGSGWTPLQWVSHCGYDTCLKILIDAGANLNVTDEFGRTPLHWAVGSQHSDCVQTLVGAGADPNIADDRGETPLHYAASGDDACIQTLVESGANPNITEIRGRTPLHTATYYDREKCIQKLIDVGATPDVPDKKGETPLQIAVRREHKECMKILIIRILADRALADDEWNLIPEESDIGHLLPVVMVRDGRDAATKLVSKLPAEKRKVLETVAMCLSRFFVHNDMAEQILVRCV